MIPRGLKKWPSKYFNMVGDQKVSKELMDHQHDKDITHVEDISFTIV